MNHNALDRRNFFKASLLGGAALAMPWSVSRALAAAASSAVKPGTAGTVSGAGLASRVALAAGEDRADLAFQALKPFSSQIATAIGDKRVIVKPNNVVIDRPLAASDAKNLEGIFEFLKSIGKVGNVAIAESPAGGSVFEGFANYGYDKVAAKYPWLASLAPVPIDGGSSWTDAGTAISFRADTAGPITFVAQLDALTLPVTDPTRDITVALVLVGDNGSIWAEKISD